MPIGWDTGLYRSICRPYLERRDSPLIHPLYWRHSRNHATSDYKDKRAETDVHVRVRTRVVAVERREAVVGVPVVATTVERAMRSIPYADGADH